MQEMLTEYLAGLPSFLQYFGTAFVLTAIYIIAYSIMTPHKEWQLIRDNVPAAAIAFGGSLIGFVLPLASAIESSINLLDSVIWGGVALIVQLLTFLLVRMLIPGISDRISNNEMASGIWLASASIAAGLLNAACMTY